MSVGFLREFNTANKYFQGETSVHARVIEAQHNFFFAFVNSFCHKLYPKRFTGSVLLGNKKEQVKSCA